MRVSMDEYFRSTYGSPTEYIDGEAVTKDGSPVLVLGIGIDHADSSEHGEVQMLLASWFFASKDPWNVIVALRPEIKVLPKLSRMPDMALLQRKSPPDAEGGPPLLVVEILSNENFSILAGIVDEYLNAGISTVWLIDPRLRTARWCTKEGWFKVAAMANCGCPVARSMSTCNP